MTEAEVRAFLAQFDEARRDFDNWPKWMQDAARTAAATFPCASSVPVVPAAMPFDGAAVLTLSERHRVLGTTNDLLAFAHGVKAAPAPDERDIDAELRRVAQVTGQPIEKVRAGFNDLRASSGVDLPDGEQP